MTCPVSSVLNCVPLHRYGSGEARAWSRHVNATECVAAGGVWFTEYGYIDIDDTARNENQCRQRNATLPRGYTTVWYFASWAAQVEGTRQCLVLGPAPECMQVGWSRVNHLGNSRDGVPLNYTWKIPHFLNNKEKLAVVRLRWVWLSCSEYHQ